MTSRKERIEYIREMLREIGDLAERDHLDLLGYILRMAEAEAINLLQSEIHELHH